MENKKVGKMPKATNPGFCYCETICKNLAASLLFKGLHIVSPPSHIKKCEISMKIIILVQPKYIIFTIYNIKTNVLQVIWEMEGFWSIWLQNKPSTSFSRKLPYCASQVYLLYSTQIPDLLHVQVKVKARFVMAVHCSHIHRTEDSSIFHFHNRKSHWINTWISTSPQKNCGDKR